MGAGQRGAVARTVGLGLTVALGAGALTACGPMPLSPSGKAAASASPTIPPTRTPSPSATAPKPKPVLATPAVAPAPRRTLTVKNLSPGPGKYGVGLVITVTFSEDLDRKARRAVQHRLAVVTNKSIGTSAWSWTDDHTVMFRPKKFWPAKTTVHVTVALDGLRPPLTAKGVQLVGKGTASRTFTIGRRMVTTIDGRTQMGTVTQDGKKVRSVAVSMGKSGWRTRNGIKVIMDREMNHVYTNTSVGDFTTPYRLVGHYNLRLTWSGEFLHSAPWAEGRLGSWPGSHGCTNASDSDAGWYYHRALYGDPVIYSNTGGRTMELDNGMGGPWNMAWKNWTGHSAAPMVPPWSKPAPKPKPAGTAARLATAV